MDDFELYYMKPLSDEVKEILRKGIDLSIMQEEPKPSIDQLIQFFDNAAQQGTMAFVKTGPLVFTLNRVTPYLGSVHLAIGGDVSAQEVITRTSNFFKWAWQNTKYNRLETRGPLKFIRVIAKATGADLAVTKKSYFDGTQMVDEYIAGWLRPGV